MTTQWNKDDLFYVCSMIEFVAVSYTHLTLPTN